jgi:hypothetical protein
MFCPKCRCEYREEFATCSDCRIPLVPELPPESKPQAGSNPTESEKISAAKYYLISALWFICGNLCWFLASYLFNPLTSHLIPLTARLLKLFHISSGFAFLLYTFSELIIAFVIAFFLAMRTGEKMLWLVTFILGIIGYPLYSTVSYNIAVHNYYGPLSEDTSQFVQAYVSTLVADLIFKPVVAWLGMRSGNQCKAIVK